MTQNNIKSLTGYFITLEGIEGVGKSTSIKALTSLLDSHRIEYVLTREPGGTEIAEKIRKVILEHYEETMSSDTEVLLYFAARAQHICQVIQPALEQGKWVICDRFTDASYAYQGAARGIPKERIAILEQWVQQGLQPNLTFLLHAPVSIALARANHRGQLDRIESEKQEFFERAQNFYLQRAKEFPSRFRLIDASVDLAQVKSQLQSTLQCFIDALGETHANPQ